MYTRYDRTLVYQRLNLEWQFQNKRLELKSRSGRLKIIVGRLTRLSPTNKLTIYKTIIKPVWTNDFELWGAAKKSNLTRLQTMKSYMKTYTKDAAYCFNWLLYLPYGQNEVTVGLLLLTYSVTQSVSNQQHDSQSEKNLEGFTDWKDFIQKGWKKLILADIAFTSKRNKFKK